MTTQEVEHEDDPEAEFWTHQYKGKRNCLGMVAVAGVLLLAAIVLPVWGMLI